MAVDVAQYERNNIKCYASAFSNIQISLCNGKVAAVLGQTHLSYANGLCAET